MNRSVVIDDPDMFGFCYLHGVHRCFLESCADNWHGIIESVISVLHPF